MLADKCASVVASGAEVCTAVDGSCLLQIGGGLARSGTGVRALHLAEILASTRLTGFPEAAQRELANVQLRANLRNATDTIRAKRARVVGELPDWEELREAGRGIKADVLAQARRVPRAVRERRRRRPARTCTGRATQRRRTRSSSTSPARTA